METNILIHHGAPVRIRAPQSHEPQLRVTGRGAVHMVSSGSHSVEPGLYSSHSCVGDMSSVKPRTQRACLFRHICLDTHSAEIFYYVRPNVSQSPVLFDQRYGHTFSFRHESPTGTEDFLPLNKHVRYKRHVRWSPVIVEGPPPRDATHLSELHMLSAPFVPTNLGHLAWEEAFPLLLAMVQLGVYEERAVVVRTHGCNESVGEAEPPAVSERAVCRKFVHGFLRPLQGAGSAAVLTLAELQAKHKPSARYVCFRRLLAGGFFDMFNSASHAGKEPFLQLYRHRVLQFHGVDPASPPRSHSLLLVQKQGRRGIANFEQVQRHLQSGCGGQCTNVPTTVATFHTMSIRRQLALVSSATIAVSPPGGVSMVLPFMPEGAVVILINYMLPHKPEGKPRVQRQSHSECSGCSWAMEAELWRHIRHIHTLMYQVWQADDFANQRPGRDSAVVIKLPRLSYLVRVALNTMDF
jgi:hypothetical protein